VPSRAIASRMGMFAQEAVRVEVQRRPQCRVDWRAFRREQSPALEKTGRLPKIPRTQNATSSVACPRPVSGRDRTTRELGERRASTAPNSTAPNSAPRAAGGNDSGDVGRGRR
jgi:hypothetical protein